MGWARVGMLVLVAALTSSRVQAADETPDAQMLLDLDILTQPEARDRDLMRKLSLFERLRLLEMFRMLDDTPAAAARRPPARPVHQRHPAYQPRPVRLRCPVRDRDAGHARYVPWAVDALTASGAPPAPPPAATAPMPPAGKER